MVAGSLKEEHNITIDGEKVEQVESFKFWAQQRLLQQLVQEISNQEI